jgi:hypothetical protein
MLHFEQSERIPSDNPQPKRPDEGRGSPSRSSSFDGAHWGRLSSAAAWFINLISVFYITRYLFGLNSIALYWGWDPQSMLTFIAGRHVFSDIVFGLGSDPIIGLGNISYPVNPLWFPLYFLAATSFGIIEDKPLSFAIGATELFAATVLCGRLNGFSIARSMAAGWLITLTTWQLFGFPKIVTIWFFFPHHAEVLSLSVLTACAALRLGDVSIRRAVLLSIAIFLGISYIVLADATSLILAVPVIGAFAMSRLILSSSRAERLQIVACWAAIGVAVLAVYARYLAGLLSYTAAGQFPDLSKRVATAFSGEISLFLWTPITSLDYTSVFTPERTMLGAALIGALLAIWRGSLKQRRLGLGVLLGQAMFTTVGVTNYWLNYWFGPTIWYFELFLFPYYSLCVCFLVFLPLAVAARCALDVIAPATATANRRTARSHCPAGRHRPLHPHRFTAGAQPRDRKRARSFFAAAATRDRHNPHSKIGDHAGSRTAVPWKGCKSDGGDLSAGAGVAALQPGALFRTIYHGQSARRTRIVAGPNPDAA